MITQNVDDLHERAGSFHVIHLHGELFKARCFACGEPVSDFAVPEDAVDRPLQLVTPPRCDRCGGYARPGVVWFGETVPQPQFKRARDLATICDLLITIGISGDLIPASRLVEERAGRFAEVNPEWTWLTPRADLVWRAMAAEALPELLRRVEQVAKIT